METIKEVVCTKTDNWKLNGKQFRQLVPTKDLPKNGRKYNVIGEVNLFTKLWKTSDGIAKPLYENHYILKEYPACVVFKASNFADLSGKPVIDLDDDDEPEYYQCLGCGWTGDDNPGVNCPRCTGATIEGVY
jgi:hypothetical protein